MLSSISTTQILQSFLNPSFSLPNQSHESSIRSQACQRSNPNPLLTAPPLHLPLGYAWRWAELNLISCNSKVFDSFPITYGVSICVKSVVTCNCACRILSISCSWWAIRITGTGRKTAAAAIDHRPGVQSSWHGISREEAVGAFPAVFGVQVLCVSCRPKHLRYHALLLRDWLPASKQAFWGLRFCAQDLQLHLLCCLAIIRFNTCGKWLLHTNM